jgi:hypothetical protein
VRASIVLCGVGLLAARVAAAAEPPPAGGVPDVTGPRSLGLSAAIGIAAGNDGIYVNPGAIAARKRYSVEASLLLDRRGAETVDQFLGGSVVDSQSSPVTAGVAYARASKGVYTGNLVNLAFAGPVYQKLYLGVSGKWLSLHGPRAVSAATADAGIFWQVSDWVSVGAAGYNLVSIDNEAVAPMAAGAGIAVGNDRTVQLTGDWRTDLDRVPGKSTNRWAGGVEVLLGNLVPVRAGFVKDETLDTRWWSLGVGLVTREGVALDVGYRQSLDDPSSRTIVAALKLFLFQ